MILLLLLPALFLLAGCENTMGPEDEASPRTFTATIDGGEPATKTLLDNGAATDPRDVRWKVGDEVRIGNGTYTVQTAADLSDGDKTAVLSGDGATKSGDVYKGYYPTGIYYDESYVELPQEQTYVTPESGDGNRVVAAHLPMYAETAPGGTHLTFKNLCAVLSLKLTGTKKVTQIVVTSRTLSLWCWFTVDWNGGDPTMSPYNASYREVRLVCTGAPGGGVQLGATPAEFCIAIPPGTYPKDDLTVSVYENGSFIAKYTNLNAPAGGSVFERSKIYDLTADTDWVKMSATTDGHSVGGNYADGTTTDLNSTWNKE